MALQFVIHVWISCLEIYHCMVLVLFLILMRVCLVGSDKNNEKVFLYIWFQIKCCCSVSSKSTMISQFHHSIYHLNIHFYILISDRSNLCNQRLLTFTLIFICEYFRRWGHIKHSFIVPIFKISGISSLDNNWVSSSRYTLATKFQGGAFEYSNILKSF